MVCWFSASGAVVGGAAASRLAPCRPASVGPSADAGWAKNLSTSEFFLRKSSRSRILLSASCICRTRTFAPLDKINRVLPSAKR